MELASMLAHEPFSDRADSISPTIGAFLRTYNDGLDDVRRQNLYPVAAAIVGTAASRAVERERVNRRLAFARQQGARLAGRRAALGLAAPGAAGAWAAAAALEADAHDETLSLVDEPVALSSRPSRRPRAADPIACSRKGCERRPERTASVPPRHRFRRLARTPALRRLIIAPDTKRSPGTAVEVARQRGPSSHETSLSPLGRVRLTLRTRGRHVD
jgi:hypothetical protein